MSNATLSPFFRGDTKVLRFSFTESDGRPIDISGHELWFTLKREIADPDEQAVLQKRVIFPPGTDSETGNGVLNLDSSETGAVDPGTYFYDLQRVIPGSPPVVTTLMSGRIAVLPDVTRRSG